MIKKHLDWLDEVIAYLGDSHPFVYVACCLAATVILTLVVSAVCILGLLVGAYLNIDTITEIALQQRFFGNTQ